jgi:hypothetical protein
VSEWVWRELEHEERERRVCLSDAPLALQSAQMALSGRFSSSPSRCLLNLSASLMVLSTYWLSLVLDCHERARTHKSANGPSSSTLTNAHAHQGQEMVRRESTAACCP